MLKNITTLLILLFSYNLAQAWDDIRRLKDPMVWFMDFIFYQFFILLLLVVLYLFYRKKINKKKLKKMKWPNRKKILLESLKKLKKHCNKTDKSTFYLELNTWFRTYFDILWIENSDILTLSDVKELKLDKSIVSLFEKSYLLEFSDKKDTNSIRIDLIDKLIKHIK